MSIIRILSPLKQLIQLHESLLQLSLLKTELLKKGDIEGIQKILKTEQKHIQAIKKFEKERLIAVDEWAEKHQLNDEEKTVTTILEHVSDDDERKQLEELSTELANLLVELKAQEGLNQQLTNQSLQFVQLNLDMISPTIEQVNYGNAKNQNDPQSKRSVFDSKA
ncbi:flagellar protein FlgN [Amphibacillus sp. MSJ-3]|uniref:flagellar protein FlgN n=1 Tax=Amphibacillus sp. MSJ-3 TaxID=2841505 RepID=UPI001C0EE1B6|nr:flagellar protein FlgN [Amphibacillus sp. MSJ-3]MBU5594107.1 flagellar protein FlgN [Amphibacillus sp. MSJ-3]